MLFSCGKVSTEVLLSCSKAENFGGLRLACHSPIPFQLAFDMLSMQVLKMLDLPADQMACLASKPQDAKIHVDFLGGLQPERLKKKLEGSPWTHAVGFRPTGLPFPEADATP